MANPKPLSLAAIVGASSDAQALEQLVTASKLTPSIQLIRALCEVPSTLSTKADEVLQRLLPDWAASSIDTSVVITGIDQVPRPQDYQQTLRLLAKHCSSGGLDTCDFQAVRSALGADDRVVDALLGLAGISYRQLADQLQRRNVSVPSNPEGPWPEYDAGLREVFSVVDDVVRGRGQYATESAPAGFKPARPIEMLWGEVSGWSGVQHALDHGVTLGALVAQRAVGSAYRQHRDSTSTQVSQCVTKQIETALKNSKLPFLRVGDDIPSKKATTVVGFKGVSLILPGPAAQYAILVRVANDPGTAKSAAAQLAQLALPKFPVACVVVGPGWSGRTRETVKATRHLRGRLFGDRQLSALVLDIQQTLDGASNVPTA